MKRVTRSAASKEPTIVTDKDKPFSDAGAAATAAATYIVDAEENGKGSNICQMITGPAATTAPTSPLLTEVYLEKVFPYFEDRKTLTTVRLVNKVWNHSSAPTLKKNLRWKVGQDKTSEGKFLKTMAEPSVASLGGSSSLLRNFNLNLNHTELNTRSRKNSVGKNVNKFMEEFGPHMIDLKIKATDINYVREHLKQTFLTNLEQLEFYDLSPEILAEPTLFDGSLPFPKVESLCFNPGWRENRGNFNEGEGRICFNMLKACPNLKSLELNLHKTCLNVLRDVKSELNLASLTSFKNMLYSVEMLELGDSPSIVALRPPDFANLVNKCPNLKVLSINIDLRTSKAKISQMLSKYSDQLEELYISLRVWMDDSDDESDVSEGGSGHTLSYYNLSDISEISFNSFNAESPDAEDSNSLLETEGLRKRARSYSDGELSNSSKIDRRAPSRRWRYGNVKKPRIPFPDFPLLKKLALLSWFYNDFNNLGSMPLLKEIDLRLSEEDDETLDLSSPQTVSYPSVTKLRFQCGLDRCTYAFEEFEEDMCLRSPMIGPLICVFPNVTELDVELADDEALRSLFRALVAGDGGSKQLKRLHLNRSHISDNGITGIEWTEELKEAHNRDNTLSSSEAIVAEHRKFPFIGDLEGLQEFTCGAFGLTNLSIQFGLISLNELTSLKFPPNKPSADDRTPQRKTPNNEHKLDKDAITLVNVRLLVDNLTNLIKLDVNDYEYDVDMAGPNNSRKSRKYNDCGINDGDLTYLKQHAPSLQNRLLVA